MDTKLAKYRQLLKDMLARYAELLNRSPKADQKSITVFDEDGDHYILHTIGWKDIQRVWNTTLYVRLRNGKFWIEVDGLEEGIATDLLEAGVPKQDIVLAFHHPQVRPWTEFAVA